MMTQWVSIQWHSLSSLRAHQTMHTATQIPYKVKYAPLVVIIPVGPSSSPEQQRIHLRLLFSSLAILWWGTQNRWHPVSSIPSLQHPPVCSSASLSAIVKPVTFSWPGRDRIVCVYAPSSPPPQQAQNTQNFLSSHGCSICCFEWWHVVDGLYTAASLEWRLYLSACPRPRQRGYSIRFQNIHVHPRTLIYQTTTHIARVLPSIPTPSSCASLYPWPTSH